MSRENFILENYSFNCVLNFVSLAQTNIIFSYKKKNKSSVVLSATERFKDHQIILIFNHVQVAFKS